MIETTGSTDRSQNMESSSVEQNTSNATVFPGNGTTASSYGLLIVLAALIPLTVLGNSLVCIVFLKYQKLRTPTNCFLFSLAISDLVVGFLLIPLWIALFTSNKFAALPKSLYDAWVVTEITCSVASMSNLAGVSIERWYGVCYPFRHRNLSFTYASFGSAMAWLYALIVALLFLLYDPANSWVIILIQCLGIGPSFIIMNLSYCAIARKIKQKTSSEHLQSRKECRTIRTLIFLSTIFIVCWLPFTVTSILYEYCEECRTYVMTRPLLYNFPKTLHYANSCVNPLLYSLFNPSFKSAFRNLFYGAHRKPSEMQRRSTLTTDKSIAMTQMIRKPNETIVVNCKEKRETNSSRDSSDIQGEKVLV